METVVSILASITSGILLMILQTFIKENRKLRNDKKTLEANHETALSNGVVCLLRIALIDYHDKYMTEKSIPTYAYENYMMMYHAYKALGGNGMIEHMKDEIEELKIGKYRGE